MSRTAGTYSLPSNSTSPAVADTTIDPDDFNELMDDVEVAINESTYTAGLGSTDNRLVRTDGTDTKKIQGSGITVDDSANMSGIAALSATTIELGHATANTLSASSGNLSIEGNVVYRAGGTDVPLADGGTGASLADPGADRIMFWDESGNTVAFLQASTGLAISGTTITTTGTFLSVKDYGATGDGSTDDTAAIQAAIDACPDASVLFFPRGTYIVDGSSTQALLIGSTNKTINLLGEGHGSWIKVGASFPNTRDIIRIATTLGTRGWSIRGLKIGGATAKGRHAIHIDTSDAGNASSAYNFLIADNLIMPTEAGRSVKHLSTATNATGGVFYSQIIRNNLDSVHLVYTGDGITIADNIFTGANIAIEVSQISGAGGLSIENNIIANLGGHIVLHSGVAPKIRGSTLEVGGTYTQANGTLIDIQGDTASVWRPLIVGNQIQVSSGASGVTQLIRLDEATNAIIDDNRMERRSATYHVTLTANADDATVGLRNQWVTNDTIGALAISDSGVRTTNLADPGADRIVFWDDSAGKYTHLEVGSGLSLSGTTLTASGSGDVTAASSFGTDNILVRSDGTGKGVQATVGMANGDDGSVTFATGTITASAPWTLSQTWNNAGVTFAGLVVDITSSASNANSKAFDVKIGGTSYIYVDRNTANVALQAGGYTLSGTSMNFVNSRDVTFTGTFAGRVAWSTDLFLSRSAAATLQLGAADAASPVAQTIRAQGSRAGTDSNVGGGNLTVQSGTGTGTGTASSLILRSPVVAASGSSAQTQTTGLTITSGIPYVPSYTVAGVPSAATAGGILYISNETGGAVLAFSDGTNWRRVTDRAIIA